MDYYTAETVDIGYQFKQEEKKIISIIQCVITIELI